MENLQHRLGGGRSIDIINTDMMQCAHPNVNQNPGSNQMDILWPSGFNHLEHIGFETHSLGSDHSERLPGWEKT